MPRARGRDGFYRDLADGDIRLAILGPSAEGSETAATAAATLLAHTHSSAGIRARPGRLTGAPSRQPGLRGPQRRTSGSISLTVFPAFLTSSVEDRDRDVERLGRPSSGRLLTWLSAGVGPANVWPAARRPVGVPHKARSLIRAVCRGWVTAARALQDMGLELDVCALMPLKRLWRWPESGTSGCMHRVIRRRKRSGRRGAPAHPGR